MRIFLYEFVTGGGTLAAGLPPGGSLLREGRAMIEALAADFVQLPGTSIDLLHDARLPELQVLGCNVHELHDAGEQRERFDGLAAAADWTLLVAPETDELLLQCCRQVRRSSGRLLSPDSSFVDLAGDKRTTHRLLHEADVPTPLQIVLRPGERLPRDFRYPAVVKPRHGAGSVGVRRVDRHDRGAALADPDSWRCLETYCPGIAASVAVLAGPAGWRTLPACLQRLSDDGCFRYLGGELPLRLPLEIRAADLARRVARALPQTVGYFGVDLVLGDRRDGSQDVVIEVNPRLTTSYVGLRKLARGNLAEAMLAVARGRSCELSFGSERIEFSAE